MVNLTTEQVADLVTTTLECFDPPKWQDLTTDLQEFHALPEILKEEKVEEDGGTSVVRFLQTNHLDSAQAVGLYAVDNPQDKDQMTRIETGWRHLTANFTLERRIVAMNSGDKALVRLVETKNHGMMMALAELMETAMWTLQSSDDGVTPLGIPYWVNRYPNGTTTPGFTGTLPWTSTYPGGLNHARWKNWAGQYAQITKSDLIRKLRTAMRKTSFKPPVNHGADYDRGKPKRVLYMALDTLLSFEDVAESQNDNLGKDVASMDGETVFRRCPLRWVPQMDSDSYGTIYGIDWSKLYPVFLQGEYMNRSPAEKAPNQHTVVVVYVDCTYTIMCHDLRGMFCLSTSTDKS